MHRPKKTITQDQNTSDYRALQTRHSHFQVGAVDLEAIPCRN
jgi:hypothetical protein